MADQDKPDREGIGKNPHLAPQTGKSAEDEFMQTIEKELRKIASIHMSRERADHTLQTTAVVNEAFIRLRGSEGKQWNDRQHFLSTASRVMRRLLVEHARRQHAPKVSLDFANVAVNPESVEVLDVQRALVEFEKIAPREARLVELHFFGGSTLNEAADILGISLRTANNDWLLARTWLQKRLSSPRRTVDSASS